MLARGARRFALSAASLFPGGGAAARERLPTIPPGNYDAAQQKAAEDFLAARTAPVFGPFEPLMHSPEVMGLTRAMGDYLRYESSLGPALSELVILVVAREWTQDYEWHVHAPIALQQGIKPEIVQAIEQGGRPEAMSDDEDICYQFRSNCIARGWSRTRPTRARNGASATKASSI